MITLLSIDAKTKYGSQLLKASGEGRVGSIQLSDVSSLPSSLPWSLLIFNVQFTVFLSDSGRSPGFIGKSSIHLLRRQSKNYTQWRTGLESAERAYNCLLGGWLGGKRSASGLFRVILQVTRSGGSAVTCLACWTSCFVLWLGFCLSSTVSIWASARAQRGDMGALCGCKQWENGRRQIIMGARNNQVRACIRDTPLNKGPVFHWCAGKIRKI